MRDLAKNKKKIRTSWGWDNNLILHHLTDLVCDKIKIRTFWGWNTVKIRTCSFRSNLLILKECNVRKARNIINTKKLLWGGHRVASRRPDAKKAACGRTNFRHFAKISSLSTGRHIWSYRFKVLNNPATIFVGKNVRRQKFSSLHKNFVTFCR